MSRTERIVFTVLALAIWIYLGFRSYHIPLIHDETVTYYLYIQEGNFIPPWAYWDANNHLLNSALGALFNAVFGHSPFALRLGSWLSFIPLVYFLYRIGTTLFTDKMSRWAFFVPLLTTPFFIEFYSLTRGYGMAMSWFLGALFYASRYIQKPTTRYFVALSITGILTSLSSLSVIVAVLIVFGWVGLHRVLIAKDRLWPFAAKWLGVLVVPQLPLVYYVFLLKEKGLLYYGGDDAVQYMIKPFARYFFNNKQLWWVAAIAVSVLILVYVFYWIQSRWKHIFTPQNIFPFVLVTALISVFAQHYVFGVNYPEDRAALYFFPLIIGSWALVSLPQRGKILWLLPLLWFPLDLATSGNVIYSKLWPNEHVPYRFWHKVDALKTDYPVSMSAYFLRHGIWNFQSLDKGYTSSPNAVEHPSKWADVLMVDSVRIHKIDLSVYRKLDYDPVSGQTLLMRSPQLVETLARDTIILNHPLTNKFTNILEFDGSVWGQNAMALYYDFELQPASDIIHLNLITTIFDTTGKEVFTIKYDLNLVSEHWTQEGTWRVKQFLPPFPENAGRFVTYFYNPRKEQHRINHMHATLHRIEEPLK